MLQLHLSINDDNFQFVSIQFNVVFRFIGSG